MHFELQNMQIDAMQNEVFPVLLGPRSQFKNIERLYCKEKGIETPWKEEQRKALILFILERDIAISDNIKTDKYINFEFEMQPLEFKLHLSLIMEIQ